ncbi:MAG: phosphoribosylformylglycinamidine synthase [Phycisphaerales bacterium]|nr:phosphoribosylformylglycinamidine synthase [Phycisphaerales bacterium]
MPADTTATTPVSHLKVYRIEVAPRPGRADPAADSVVRAAASLSLPVASARTTSVYFIQADLDQPQIESVKAALLADPVTESASVGAAPVRPGTRVVEVHPLPGVMDPIAQSVKLAIRDLLGMAVEVATGRRFDLAGEGLTQEHAAALARSALANEVIQRVHLEPWSPAAFPQGRPHSNELRHIEIIGLSETHLEKLSRDAHLFLSLDEMRAVQAEYERRGRNPTDIELETLAQTWSEHCVHKTLKSTIRYQNDGNGAGGRGGASSLDADVLKWSGRPGHEIQPDGSVVIHNLLKSTVAAATHELIKDGLDWTLSVFVDNAGVIAFDDEHAVCVKVETHNHPSAIEPYGGAATGAGGCIRDVIGTGLAARPIANTDVFCVAHPDSYGGARSGAGQSLPPGCLHPRRILSQVVAGVRDYGNRMGIPTVNGAVYFDDRYVGNPLVFCGCIGVMPRDRIKGKVNSGDLIVALGGRTGRDGIHGATFSSAELEQSSADEFSHAVQIGNAIEEKRVLDAILRARDEQPQPLFSGLTDCGAGGFSSAVGEMGKDTGASVHLEKAPLKYAGLSYTEIWISEAQERMVLAVPHANLAVLRRICDEESVELAVLGTFAPPPGSARGDPDLALYFRGEEVGRLSMRFLHEGIPTPRREATWSGGRRAASETRVGGTGVSPVDTRVHQSRSLEQTLLTLLAHPNIASKHWIIRQYDHEVRGGTVIKPLVGPALSGPSDASVIKPVPRSKRGLAIACGLQTGMGDPSIAGAFADPYLMTLAAVDEAVRNLVCVGADPSRIAILDNFCWPSCKKPENLGSLVRAAEACYDAAKAYRTPFVSGKDSLNNQLTLADGTTIEIPPTLLVTGIGIVSDVASCITMDAKQSGNVLVLVGPVGSGLGGSHFQRIISSGKGVPAVRSAEHDLSVPRTDLSLGPATARAVAGVIASGLVRSAHDVSDGGLLAAVSEMLIAGSTPGQPIGATLDLGERDLDPIAELFNESPSQYVIEVVPLDMPSLKAALGGIPHAVIGRLDGTGDLVVNAQMSAVPVASLREAWLGTLDW